MNTVTMEIGIGLYGLLAFAVALLASREFGRSAVGWFVLSLILTPLVGLLLFMLPPRRRPCPFCAEPIQPSAVLCRFCGRDVLPAADTAGLPRTTKAVLLILVVAVILTALSQCQYRFGWWSSEKPGLDVKAREPLSTTAGWTGRCPDLFCLSQGGPACLD